MTNTKKLAKIGKSVAFTPVTGSSLVEGYARIGTDLALKFKGSTYLYRGVPDVTYTDFVAADSKGKFFASSIRNKFVGELTE
jgi:hypothetical protein